LYNFREEGSKRVATIQKGIRVRLYPTEEQRVLIDRTIGCCRFVHNQTLENCIQSYEQTKHLPSKNERITNLVSLKEEFEFLKEVDAKALQQSVRDLNFAIDNFFKNRSHFGFPKFKSKHDLKQSYRTPHSGGTADVVDGRHIKLPKLGSVRTKRFDMPKVYKILNITVEKTNTDKYYASICIETEIQPLPKTGKQVGFDLGLIDLLIGSDGTRVERPKFSYVYKEKLAKEQRKLSKMRTKLERTNANLDECKNYQKQKHKVAKLHEHIANCAKDFNHKLSRELVEEYDLIATEDLNVSGLIKNHYLAYSIADVRWGQLLGFIKYKCQWYGKNFVQVDRFYASSKICSCCGTYHKDIVSSLKVREWTCPDCGAHHDRDVNAAKNILNQALSVGV
jgi:transposase, IS605 orfB family